MDFGRPLPPHHRTSLCSRIVRHRNRMLRLALRGMFLGVVVTTVVLVRSTLAQCQSWSPDFAAPGVSGTVQAAVSWDDGNGSDLYLGGAFLAAGGVATNRIARFDGSGWSALGSGLDNDVFALLGTQGTAAPGLVVGGNFTHAGGLVARGVAAWNGTSAQSMTSLKLAKPWASHSKAGCKTRSGRTWAYASAAARMPSDMPKRTQSEMFWPVNSSISRVTPILSTRR